MKDYHVLSLSGGKDSTALAFFMKENMPEVFEDLELVFCDTECELPETYDYLNKIELFLCKKITRIKPNYNFEHLFNRYGLLPSAMKRWCTVEMKTKTFKNFLNNKKMTGRTINIYIGIRADESGRVNHSHDDEMLHQIYPFVDYNIIKQDVLDILTKNSIGLPDYYNWRSRSGCFFCFFQKKIEWIGLLEHHPHLYNMAMKYEEEGNNKRNKIFTLCQDISLRELKNKKNVQNIKNLHFAKNKKQNSKSYTLFDIL